MSEKSNEITAIPELLRLLDLQGCLVTIDAIGTQTKIAKMILQKGADYLLRVKNNQAKLYRTLEMLFAYDQQQGFHKAPYPYAKEVQKGLGVLTSENVGEPPPSQYLTRGLQRAQWVGLQSLVLLIRRQIIAGEETVKICYFISSLEANAQRILQTSRQPWGIEKGLHWVLDVAFHEVRSRVRKDHAPANLAVLRH